MGFFGSLHSGSGAPQPQSHTPPSPKYAVEHVQDVGMQSCVNAQLESAPHVPHEPPQPSSPQFLPLQSGVHAAVHRPSAAQNGALTPQVPHEPPQPSSPHCLPAHLGAQPHLAW